MPFDTVSVSISFLKGKKLWIYFKCYQILELMLSNLIFLLVCKKPNYLPGHLIWVLSHRLVKLRDRSLLKAKSDTVLGYVKFYFEILLSIIGNRIIGTCLQQSSINRSSYKHHYPILARTAGHLSPSVHAYNDCVSYKCSCLSECFLSLFIIIFWKN